jgi:hypothetical protein
MASNLFRMLYSFISSRLFRADLRRHTIHQFIGRPVVPRKMPSHTRHFLVFFASGGTR